MCTRLLDMAAKYGDPEEEAICRTGTVSRQERARSGAAVASGLDQPQRRIVAGDRLADPEQRECREQHRALAMLHAKLAGQPFTTELPVHATEAVTPAPPIADLSTRTLPLITTGELVPKGNPDRLNAAASRQWYRYSIEGLDALSATDWDCVHRGFYTAIVKENTNYIVPLRVVRQLEREHVIGGVYPWFFSASGVGTPDSYSQPMGQAMAAELKQAGVDAALLVAT